jgi:hypothetical protein
MTPILILDDQDQVLPTDYCRPLYIDVSGESCDKEGFPKNFAKWVPVNLIIPKYFQLLKVDSLRQEGYAFEFARGSIPVSHKLDMRLYPKIAPKEANA